MKIRIDAREFTQIVKSINWPGRYSHAILEHALLVADKDGVHISRTNMDIYATIDIRGEILEPGSCLIPVKKVLAVLKNCRGEIPIEFDGDYLKVGEYQLDTFPAENYPKWPDDGFENIGTIQGHVLAQAIYNCAPWTFREEDDSALQGFCLEDGKLVTSNRHCMFQAEVGLEYDRQLVIHHSLGLLQKINLEGKIQVARSEKRLSLKGGNFEAFVRLLDGKYPPWQAIAPSSGYPLKIDARTLAGGLKEVINYAKAVSDEKQHVPVFLQWLEDHVELYGEFGEGTKVFRKALADINMPFPVSMPLNAVYLLTAVKNWNGEITLWHPGNMKRPFLITDGATFKYLQMPTAPTENCDECGDCHDCPEYCHLFPEDAPLQEIPYSPDIGAISKPAPKRAVSRKHTVRKVTRPSKKKTSGQEVQEKALAELKAKADFWETEALKKEEHVRNLEAELARLQDTYRALLQFQALRPNGKGRYAYIDGRQYLFSQGKIFNEDGNEVGHYDRKGNGELKGQSFRIQREYVIALN